MKQKCDELESEVTEKKNNLEDINSIIVCKADELYTLEQNVSELEADILTARAEINALQIDVEEKKDAKRLINMIDAANKEIKNRQPYNIKIIEEHEVRHNPITKKETRPADQAFEESFNFYKSFKISSVEIFQPCTEQGLYKVSELENLSSLASA